MCTTCVDDVVVPSPLFVSHFIRTVVRAVDRGAADAVVSVVFSYVGTVKLVTSTVPDAVDVLGVRRPATFPDTVSASFFLTTAVSIADSKDSIPVSAVIDPADI